MTLMTIVRDAVAGFTAGFATGYFMNEFQQENLLRFSRDVLKEEERSTSEEDFKKIERSVASQAFNNKVLMPVAYGYVISALSSLVEAPVTAGMYYEHLAAAITGSIAGVQVGRAVKRWRTKEFREEIRIGAEMREHPEKMLELLPEDRAEIVRKTEARAEEHYLAEGMCPMIPIEYGIGIEQAIAGRPAYAVRVQKWGAKRFEQITERGMQKFTLRTICESNEKLNRAILIRQPKGLRSRAYVVSNEHVDTYDVMIPGMVTPAGDPNPAGNPTLALVDTREWNQDYEWMHNEIYGSDDPVILLRVWQDISRKELSAHIGTLYRAIAQERTQRDARMN